MSDLIVCKAGKGQDDVTLDVDPEGPTDCQLAVSAKFRSGRAVDVTDAACVSLRLDTHGYGDTLSASLLTVSASKYSRPLIVNATYMSGGDFATVDRMLYAKGYAFVGTTLGGEGHNADDLTVRSGASAVYFTRAHYDSGASKLVSASYTLERRRRPDTIHRLHGA